VGGILSGAAPGALNPRVREDFVFLIARSNASPHNREDFIARRLNPCIILSFARILEGRMEIPIRKGQDVGRVLRALRKSQGLRQDDAAGAVGVSENFLGKVERGSESVQWGKLFQVADALGAKIIIDVPDDSIQPEDLPKAGM